MFLPTVVTGFALVSVLGCIAGVNEAIILDASCNGNTTLLSLQIND